MFLQLGGACLCIWVMNWVFMIREVLQHTPNWRDGDVDGEEIVQNFMMNTPLDRLMFIQKLAQINPMMFVSGIVLLMFGLLL